MQETTEKELQIPLSRLLLQASWRFISYGKFDGNISYTINFLANLRFLEFSSTNTLNAVFILLQTYLAEFVSSP